MTHNSVLFHSNTLTKITNQTNKRATLILPSFRKLVNSDSTMDAAQRFNELLNQIENSKLNYVISKTPFSANISVKDLTKKFHDKEVSGKKEIVI